jgi:hypothetical protein
MRFVARALLLVSAVVLALPPAWCCLFARTVGCPEFKAATAAAKSTAPVCHGHCPFRCGQAACSRSCPPAPSRPCPTPSRPCYWVCVDRVAPPSPDGPEAPGLDLALPALLPPVLVPCPSSLALGTGRPEAPAPGPPPLNVLYCTWLC